MTAQSVAFSSHEPLATLREAYRQSKKDTIDPLMEGLVTRRRIPALLGRLASHADALLLALWRKAGLPDGFCLVAVGGFGRKALFPASDVDVLLLIPGPTALADDDPLRPRIETFVSSCWDVGLEIGFSVRTVAESLHDAAADVTVQTAMLEARPVCGDAALFAGFRQRFLEQIDPLSFLHAKTLEMRQRHSRYENTPYALEPNCKESPGGLRDLQMILWVAQAAGLGGTWNELAANGIATELEAAELTRTEADLSLIRAKLHALTGRHEDRLLFDLQATVAEAFGYSSSNPRGKKLPMRASEQLMRAYYWCAKAVSQLSQILLLNIAERLQPSVHRLRPLNDRFFDKAGMIEVATDDLYERNPHAILETFLLYETQVGLKGLSARTLRALYNSRDVMDGAFRRDPENRHLFMQIMQQPAGITHALRLMNNTSVLGRYLWPFRQIVGQMQHDLFHVYTVDQHILMVVRNMRRFFMPEHAHEYPFCSHLAAGWEQPWILYVAALFHDIGKGRGGDHSDIGAHEMQKFCRQHGIGPEDADLLVFLVREHLRMSQVAQKQDLSDPDVIGEFARCVGNERYLTGLYLLTVADIRGTSPKVWNAWKGKLLEDLYRATALMLGGIAPDPDAEIEMRKREARVLLALEHIPADGLARFWSGLNLSYFMRHSADEVAWHARHILGQPPQQGSASIDTTLVRARKSVVGEGIQIFIYTPDRTDLFARICSYFDQAEYEILDARIHTTGQGHALDTFQILLEFSTETPEQTAQHLEYGLAHYLARETPLPQPSSRRVSRRVKNFPVPTRIQLEPDDKAQNWLLNISVSDRPGLLYSIAWTLAQFHLSILLAKITTLGERAEDSFLIEGDALRDHQLQLEFERELLRRCAPPL